MATKVEASSTRQDKHRTGRLFTWMIIAAVVAVVVVGAALLLADDDGSVTVTFDGETAVYDGATTLEAGEVTFVLDAEGYDPGAALVVSELVDDSITREMLDLWAEQNSARTIPSFIGAYHVAFTTDDELVIERTWTLEPDTRYTVSVHTSPTDTDRVHWAEVVEVK